MQILDFHGPPSSPYSASPSQLEAAFTAIDEHYGSFDNYLHEGLGIDEATLEQLRSALLE